MNDKQSTQKDDIELLDYRICLKGQLNERWTAWFDGLTITLDGHGNTILYGPIKDQAELQGLIKKIYSLGLTLVSVNPQEKKGDD